ncbi:MAG TPA: hypothetical protein VK601_21785, partial [Kofleriaceae bacterium]|nr:hypothetical protein [Kofleriaceae bacterium]
MAVRRWGWARSGSASGRWPGSVDGHSGRYFWIAVRARLPSRTFKTEHSTYHYHHGMHAKV